MCGWEYEIITTFRRYHFFRNESSSVDFWRAQVFQLLKVCYRDGVSFPDSLRVRCISKEFTGPNLVPEFGGVLSGLWKKSGDIRPSNQTEWLVLWWSASHEVFSHQTRDLECFADSSNTPWNHPTNFHQNRFAEVLHMFLLWSCVPLFQQCHLSQNDEV